MPLIACAAFLVGRGPDTTHLLAKDLQGGYMCFNFTILQLIAIAAAKPIIEFFSLFSLSTIPDEYVFHRFITIFPSLHLLCIHDHEEFLWQHLIKGL